MLYALCPMLFFMIYALCSRRRAQHLVTIVTLVALGLMVFAGIGRAQTKSTFTPRVSLSETYDDNIDLEPDNELEDWITTVFPGFLLELDSQKTKLELDLEAGFSFYAKHPNRDTNRYQGRLSWDQGLTQRLSLRVNDTFSRSEDPITLEDGRIVDITQGREVQYRNTGEASMSYQFGAEDIVTLGYRNHLLDSRSDQTEDSRGNEGFLNLDTWFGPKFGVGLNSSIIRYNFHQPNGYTGIPTSDFYNYSAEITANYRWRPQHIAYVRYSITYQDFDVEVIDDDYVVLQPTVGLNLSFGPHTQLGAEIGYFRQEFEDRGGQDGFVLNANFNIQRERTTFTIQSNTGYDLNYGTSNNRGFSKYSDSSARVDYQLVEDLSIFATARYRWEDFTEIDQTDHTYGGRGGLNYAFGDWLNLSLEGGHLRRDSNVSSEEFTDNRVTLRITTAYPIPFGD